MKRFFVVGVMSAALFVAGCKDKHSPSCKQSAQLTAPWTGYGFAVDDGRVCASSADEAKIEFTSGTKAQWMSAFEARIVAAGYKKRDCKNDFCVYMKDKAKVTMHGLEARTWRTLILRSK